MPPGWTGRVEVWLWAGQCVCEWCAPAGPLRTGRARRSSFSLARKVFRRQNIIIQRKFRTSNTETEVTHRPGAQRGRREAGGESRWKVTSHTALAAGVVKEGASRGRALVYLCQALPWDFLYLMVKPSEVAPVSWAVCVSRPQPTPPS